MVWVITPLGLKDYTPIWRTITLGIRRKYVCLYSLYSPILKRVISVIKNHPPSSPKKTFEHYNSRIQYCLACENPPAGSCLQIGAPCYQQTLHARSLGFESVFRLAVRESKVGLLYVGG